MHIYTLPLRHDEAVDPYQILFIQILYRISTLCNSLIINEQVCFSYILEAPSYALNDKRSSYSVFLLLATFGFFSSVLEMKARKKASDAQSSSSNNTNNNMNIGAYEDDINDKQSRNRRQYITKYQLLYTVLQYVRKVLQVSTSSICTFISFLLILSSFIFTSNDTTDNKQQSTMISIGMAYIFIVKPILSTLYIVLCSSDVDGASHSAESNGRNNSTLQTTTNLITTRIIALTFLLSIICNQFPKWLSKLVACIAVFVFGLASRQLSSSTSHTNTTTQTDQASATDNSSNYSNTTTMINRLQRVYTKLGLKERAGKSALVLFYYMNSCVQYTVSIIWLFYLNLFAFILLPLQTTCTNISYNHLPSFS